MPTFLFSEIVFGPVRSRRLGVSLGINLLPVTGKLCNYDCVYCECGWTGRGVHTGKVPSRQQVYEALEAKLKDMHKEGKGPDVITYAGNGEPTLHPEFPQVIEDSIVLRNRYFPKAKIAVLSNATTISRPGVREALLKADQNILKLDSAISETLEAMNRPLVRVDMGGLIEALASFGENLTIQTLFVRGAHNGKKIDNTNPVELEAWLNALKVIKPQEVMIYTISRDTPEGTELRKVPGKELEKIAAMVGDLGIRTQVSA